MHLRMHLTGEQARASLAPVSDSMLVVAGPGSGKTRVLTHRIAHLIKGGVDPRSIVAMTFTNKAAREMRERVTELVGPMATFPFVGTFHSFCYRVLKEQGVVFRIADAAKQRETLRQVVPDTCDSRGLVGGDVRDIQLLISKAKKSGSMPGGLSDRIYAHYLKSLREAGLYDFDDLIIEAARLLTKESSRYVLNFIDAVLVDEGQDIDSHQYELVKILSKGASLFVVGDNMQAIYGWRGGNSSFMSRFPKEMDMKVLELTSNFRSGASIVSLANEISSGHDSFDKVLRPQGKTPGQVVLKIVDRERMQLSIALGIAKRAVARGKTAAILVRTGFQSWTIQKVLSRARVPFNRRTQSDLDETATARRMVAVYNALAEPSYHSVVDGLEMIDGIGKVRARKVASAMETSTLNGLGEAIRKQSPGIRGKLEDVASVGDVSMMSPEEMLGVLFKILSIEDNTVTAIELRKRAVACDSVDELVEELVLSTKFDEDITAPVLVSTIHGVKGLEFDYVVLMNVNNGSIPHFRGHSVEEERNLLYVAATRAREVFVGIARKDFEVAGSTQAVSDFCFDISSFKEELKNAGCEESIIDLSA